MAHIKSDGNGGLIISKTAMGAVAFILLLLGSLIPLVLSWGSVQNSVSVLENKMNFIEPKVIDSETRMAVLVTKVDLISDDIKEIKVSLRNMNHKDG